MLQTHTYITASYPSYVWHMDYINKAIRLRRNFGRRRANWEPHLENTKQFVIKAAKSCHNRKKAVVLGSGRLLDVPVKELAAMFEEVVLVDLVHLPDIQQYIKTFNNVRLVHGDITNISHELYDAVNQGHNKLPLKTPVFPSVDEHTGLVISLNILSQLYAFPYQYVCNNTAIHSEAALEHWCNEIVKAHYSALKSLSCDVCLVADYEYVRKDGEGNIVEEGSTIRGFSLPEPDTTWIWHIIPFGEEPNNLAKELLVGAWHIAGQKK